MWIVRLVLDQISGALSDHPYHLNGGQYLFMNLPGRERHSHVHVAELEANDFIATVSDSLKSVTESPFYWIDR